MHKMIPLEESKTRYSGSMRSHDRLHGTDNKATGVNAVIRERLSTRPLSRENHPKILFKRKKAEELNANKSFDDRLFAIEALNSEGRPFLAKRTSL